MSSRITFLLIFISLVVLPVGKGYGQLIGSQQCHLSKTKSYVNTFTNRIISNNPFDIIHYTLELDLYNNYISPYPHSFTGVEIVQIKADSTLNTVTLNAVNSSLEIESVSMAAVSFSHDSDILTINLDKTYSPGDTLEVKINYNHKNVVDNAFYVGGGFVFTDCEPEGARRWFPCLDRPVDKATVDLIAKVPANVMLASNGRLEDSTMVGDTIYYHWKSRDPISTYLVVISSSNNYNLDIIYWDDKSTVKDENIPIRFYYQPGEDPSYIQSIVLPMTDYFSEIFGTYPFEKNGFATLNNLFAPLGMENQSMISLCEDCWIEWLTAHEVAHQWFSAMIGPATWADIWLNESFATYGDALWVEHTSGYSAYKNQINQNANYYLNNNPGWALYNPDWAINTPPGNALFNFAITYMKSCCVLYQLRYVLGDEDFFAAVKDYATDTVNFKYKTATTADFVAKMNESTGQDLNWFFDQWVFNPNHPKYNNTYEISFVDTFWNLSFTINQTQTNTVFFTMPIELEIEFIDGTDTLITIWNDENNQTFDFAFAKEPTETRFDPNNNIVLKMANTVLVSIDQDAGNTIEYYSLNQNYPNPFNPATKITFQIPELSFVSIKVYDVLGNEITTLVNEEKPAGSYEIEFDATGLPSGIYFYKLQTDGYVEIRKMLLLK